MQPKPEARIYPGEVYVRWEQDYFDSSVFMLHFSMNQIVVDEIFGSRNGDFAKPMMNIRSIDSDNVGRWFYVNDGYPIDEEFYIKTGYILSTNPNNVRNKEIRETYYKMNPPA